jgi:alkanesulfonate monooxygenase SsuD/methylene tetrahydromethanopterin reductase-like flavin-dependent oxidoreductase (luciferase family)
LTKQLAFGVHLPVMGFDNSSTRNGGKEKSHSREQVLLYAIKAESLGYDSLSVNDHIIFRTSWLDSISVLAAVAAVTNRIKLGTSLLNIVVRNPVICAKSLSAIDILSSGRLFAAGVGPGSHKGDYDVCGIPFEERWSRFNEALEILKMLLFGSTDHCIKKIRAFYEAGAKRIHFWPVSDYLEQIETFRDEIVSCY